MRQLNSIVLASTNLHKLEEFRALFKGLSDLKITPIQDIVRNAQKLAFVENGATYLDNATKKARSANQGCHYPCLADDSGLEVDVLDKRPGVFTQRYATPKAGQSQDQANIDKLLLELRGVPMEKRTARFVACLALVIEGLLITATGTLEGIIAEAPQGAGGFGYDPIFIPKGGMKSLAELPMSEKNQISHRALAVKDLLAQIKNYAIIIAKP